MKTLKQLAMGGILLAACGTASAVIIDFDSLASGTTVTNQFAGDGVTFSGTNSPLTDGNFQSSYGPLASGNILRSGGGTPNVIDLDFSIAVDTVAGDIIFRETGFVATLEVFDSLDNLLATITTAPDTGTGDEVTLSLSAAGIASARFSFDVNDSIVGFDNLDFSGPSRVPAPATLALLGLGLVGLGAAGRRKRG
jgi:hypothetical protein